MEHRDPITNTQTAASERQAPVINITDEWAFKEGKKDTMNTMLANWACIIQSSVHLNQKSPVWNETQSSVVVNIKINFRVVSKNKNKNKKSKASPNIQAWFAFVQSHDIVSHLPPTATHLIYMLALFQS